MSVSLAVNPEGVHAVPAYSHALVRQGTPVFLTGQIALDEAGQLVGPGDAGAQAEQAWRNIERILEALGAGLGDIVKLTTFGVSLDDLPAIASARARRFAPGRFPASTFLVVASLARAEYLVEIEATVMLDDDQLARIGIGCAAHAASANSSEVR